MKIGAYIRIESFAVTNLRGISTRLNAFKRSKTTIDPDKIFEEIFPRFSASCWEISFDVDPGLS